MKKFSPPIAPMRRAAPARARALARPRSRATRCAMGWACRCSPTRRWRPRSRSWHGGSPGTARATRAAPLRCASPRRRSTCCGCAACAKRSWPRAMARVTSRRAWCGSTAMSAARCRGASPPSRHSMRCKARPRPGGAATRGSPSPL